MNPALEQLRQALTSKAGKRDKTVQEKKPCSIPDPIVYATAGTHVASDGKPYTITYE